jgi:hypothetical protein
LKRARDFAQRPHDIRPEVRPVAGGVVPQADEENLGLVLGEEARRQPEIEAQREESKQGCGDQPGPTMGHREGQLPARGRQLSTSV